MTVTETSSTQSFQQEEVGTQLRLRPFVAPDGMIRMEIHPERSSGTLVNGVPQTRTSEVTTNVIVPNGSTIVIAGLMEEQEVVAEDGIPLLCRLPWIGALFRHRSVTTVKKELIVLLTPRIWDPDEEGPPIDPRNHLWHENIDILQ
jgi:type II secretory pathway component GspD/PulD (secretin)